MKWIIDRFEGDYALCEIENGTVLNVPRNALPENAREGDVISVFIDIGETENRKSNVNKLMNDLFVD
ncbi:MAG: DUF3006 domain-containing protein [Eubacterium sp.]|nr:DUF3006 domain-containing protein [Eubacterium sp.]